MCPGSSWHAGGVLRVRQNSAWWTIHHSRDRHVYGTFLVLEHPLQRDFLYSNETFSFVLPSLNNEANIGTRVSDDSIHCQKIVIEK
jgi:hypothetical protein